MSQHNIIGSEAFSNRTHVMVQGMRTGAFRRRRARSTLTYMIVAVLALVVGGVVATLALAPLLADRNAAKPAIIAVPVPQAVTPAPAAPAAP
ncbi:hypothetical protein [Brevundimonas diminuta]|uniref:hypothetical protein n=1 Tax=Brevundimonas diminuta TaxID=293 RepID=UPI00320B7FC3